MERYNKKTLKPFVIISAELDSNSNAENRFVSRNLLHILELNEINFKVVIGVYKGVKEISYLIIEPNVDQILHLSAKYKQESILVVSEDRTASLSYSDGKTESIGSWKEVTRLKAESCDCHTYDPILNTHYICE